jgi:hypothetical protein
VKAQINGLNSFNSSLYLSGLAPVLRHTPREEFHFFLTSPLCHHLSADDKVQVGDIIAIRDGDGDDVSAATHLTDSLVFEKRGTEPHSLYLVSLKGEVENRYQVAEKVHHFEVFHCDNFADYRKKQADKFGFLVALHEQINQVELEIASTLPVKTALSAAQAADLQARIKTLIGHYKDEKKKKVPANVDRSFLVEGLKIRLMGIAAHLKENSKSVSESDVEIKKPLIELIETSVPSAP